MADSENYRHYYWYTALVVILYAVIFYYGLGSYGLMDNNEGLYAEVPREMLDSRDFIIPHLNGVPYIEKPPLLYWFTAASYRVFGFNEFAARFTPATAGFLTGLLLMRFLFIRANPPAALLAGLMWGTSIGVTLFARVIFFDMLMTLMLTWALTSFFLWFETRRRKYLYQAYIALALGVLTKGLLAAVLPAGVVIIFLLATRNSRTASSNNQRDSLRQEIRKMLDPVCIGLFLLIVMPWHIAAYFRDNNFLWFYFVNEHILRFLGMRSPHDYYSGPAYYYVSRLPAYLFPWTPFLLLFLWPRSGMNAENKIRAPTDRHQAFFLWIWFAAFMLFFTISRAKANYYIITALPPLFLLMAERMLAQRKLLRSTVIPVIFTLQAIVLAATVWIVLAGDMPVLRTYKDMVPGWLAWPMSGAILTAAAGVWIYRHRRPIAGMVIAQVLIHATLFLAVLSVMPYCETELSTRQVVRDIHHENPRIPLFLYRRFEGYMASAVFYNQEPIPIIDSCSDDLLYGRLQERSDILFPGNHDMYQGMNPDDAFVLVAKNDREKFLETFGPRGFVLWKDYGRLQVFKVHPNPVAHLAEE